MQYLSNEKSRFGIVVTLLMLFFLITTVSCSNSGTEAANSNSKIDTTTIDSLNARANSLWSSIPDSMITMSKRIVATCDSVGYTAGKIDALRNLGRGYYETGNYNEAIQQYNKSLEIALETGNMERAVKIYSNLAMPYIALGKHKDALAELNKALDGADNYNLPKVKAHATHNIGMVYHYQLMMDSAISYYTRSQQQYEQMGDTSKSSFILGNIGHIFLNKGDFERAKANYLQSLKLAETQKNRKAIGNAQQSLGALFLEMKDLKNALIHFLKAKQTLESTGEKTEYLRLLDNLSETYFQIGDTATAVSYAKACQSLAQSHGQLYYLQSSSKRLSEFYERNKDFGQSLAFYKIYKAASDSLYSNENKEELVRKEEEFKFKKQQSDIKAVYSAKVSRRNAILVIALVVILSMSVIGFLLIKNFKQAQKNNKMLQSTNAFIEEQVILLEEANKFKKSLISIIAHDIRSPINSLLYILKPFKDGLISESQTRELLSSCYDEIDTLTIHIDNLLLWAIQHLHTVHLSVANFNIRALFEDIVKLYERRLSEKQLTAAIDCDASLAISSDREVINIIVRNLVDNAIKFSRSGEKIVIQAKTNARGDRVIFSVADAGHGIAKHVRDKIYSDAKPISLNGTSDEEGSGLGLKLCIYYLALCQSELQIHSIDGKGAIFSFELQSSAHDL
ncbi:MULTISPECIES: tetratricopeptide repeat-containing sensor histidine kinase [unclassified Sphingobacterium]|uniref:tetratricopeptide repeat-containing sensor histidine kinase n=1 Tax=unclassified Sphingobacterium TaxID=2609468 RepID=UPI0025EE2BE0|nr:MULTISPECIES: tetratricopeptide repeat-containing sensor histidine kinase [unclassified Sphingobacterium]